MDVHGRVAAALDASVKAADERLRRHGAGGATPEGVPRFRGFPAGLAPRRRRCRRDLTPCESTLRNHTGEQGGLEGGPEDRVSVDRGIDCLD